ncbi:xylulokinase [Chachezhania sediminis]|uniref:xylulokinase n=1 Tax=Chachezhania sediminis TaxID=2599291 RepID=UPI00131C5A55|nr:FGGY-family carbohydrate kinase [Chachezhania sediminis]
MAQVLAYDLGGSSLRLAIVEADGTLSDMVRKPLSLTQSGDRSEADPTLWWSAFREAGTELAARGHDFAAVTAIGGCGFTRTQVLLDADDQPVRPAIAFQDARAADLLEELQAEAPAPLRSLYVNLGPFDPLARLLWLQRYEPENWARARTVIEPKDYLNLCLTGIAAVDTISQTPNRRVLGIDASAGLATLGIDADLIPQVISPFDIVGPVRHGLPAPFDRLAGVPVHCGSLDTWTCVLGSGGLVPGAGYGISGTSDVFGVITATRADAPGLLTVEWGPDLWQLGGPSQGAASRLQWAAERFHKGQGMGAAVDAALADISPAPLFLPFLDGERTPFWDPALRGAFIGLDAGHDADAFLRGVAEGMAYLSREILLRAETATGERIGHVSFSGGLAGHPGLCQLKADVLDRPVLVPHSAETGLLGAARLPLGPDRALTALPSDASTTYLPDPDRRAYHDARFGMFRLATEALRPVLHKMAADGVR